MQLNAYKIQNTVLLIVVLLFYFNKDDDYVIYILGPSFTQIIACRHNCWIFQDRCCNCLYLQNGRMFYFFPIKFPHWHVSSGAWWHSMGKISIFFSKS